MSKLPKDVLTHLADRKEDGEEWTSNIFSRVTDFCDHYFLFAIDTRLFDCAIFLMVTSLTVSLNLSFSGFHSRELATFTSPVSSTAINSDYFLSPIQILGWFCIEKQCLRGSLTDL